MMNLCALPLLLLAFANDPAGLPTADPESAGLSPRHRQAIDELIADALAREQAPGCVLLVGHRGKIVLHKAYGRRQLVPQKLPMTADTVFDLASVTKPVATATSIMILFERGRLKLDDPVARHVPEFAQNGKERITVLHLLTHQGGLIADNALSDYENGPKEAMERIYALKPLAAPGERFIYTDVGFIMLGEIVRRLSGKTVHEFAHENIFAPLGMRETGYLPNQDLRKRAAPTEQREGRWMVGEVHDPRSYKLGKVAGHAGLFSTATDLSRYAQMMLNGGEYAGVRLLQPETVRTMTTAHKVPGGLRGLGWDMRTGYSSNRGDLFSRRAFGHGGFTGTALWIDPELELFVIFLSNRVHPNGKGLVNPSIGRIGTIVSAAVVAERQKSERPAPAGSAARRSSTTGVLTGIDVLVRDRFALLKGRRVGLITNHTGRASDGRSTIALLHQAPEVELVALFSPEHGLEGKIDELVGDAKDAATGLPIYSLYGKTRKPNPEQLHGIDTLVYDIQDIGTRFYTYFATLGHALQTAAEHRLRFVVLDRPNPIGGVDVAGPLLDAGKESFVGFHTIPVRHGLTAGEFAQMINLEKKIGADLVVVKVEGWRRCDRFDATGLVWINPSPNMRCLTQAMLYPGIGLLETTNLSVGRGTDTPFEVIGADWLDGRRLAVALGQAGLPGVRFVPIEFTPTSSKFQGKKCGGVNIIVTDWAAFLPVRTGIEIACQLRHLYPQEWNVSAFDRLLSSRRTMEALAAGQGAVEIEALWQADLARFAERRRPFLLYKD